MYKTIYITLTHTYKTHIICNILIFFLKGYFLYIDSSKQFEGEQAGVLTPVFKASEGVCHLRFWYTMYGSPSMGSLEVFQSKISH